MGIFKKLFGSHSDRELKRIYPIADRVMALDGEYSKLTDEQLKAKTGEFKERLAQGETLDDLLPEAFATAREAASCSIRGGSPRCAPVKARPWWLSCRPT